MHGLTIVSTGLRRLLERVTLLSSPPVFVGNYLSVGGAVDTHHNYTLGAELHFEQNYTLGSRTTL